MKSILDQLIHPSSASFNAISSCGTSLDASLALPTLKPTFEDFPLVLTMGMLSLGQASENINPSQRLLVIDMELDRRGHELAMHEMLFVSDQLQRHASFSSCSGPWGVSLGSSDGNLIELPCLVIMAGAFEELHRYMQKLQSLPFLLPAVASAKPLCEGC